jgi:hypothetical protein
LFKKGRILIKRIFLCDFIEFVEFGTSKEEKYILETATGCKEICGGSDLDYNPKLIDVKIEKYFQETKKFHPL